MPTFSIDYFDEDFTSDMRYLLQNRYFYVSTEFETQTFSESSLCVNEAIQSATGLNLTDMINQCFPHAKLKNLNNISPVVYPNQLPRSFDILEVMCAAAPILGGVKGIF